MRAYCFEFLKSLKIQFKGVGRRGGHINFPLKYLIFVHALAKALIMQ